MHDLLIPRGNNCWLLIYFGNFLQQFLLQRLQKNGKKTDLKIRIKLAGYMFTTWDRTLSIPFKFAFSIDYRMLCQSSFFIIILVVCFILHSILHIFCTLWIFHCPSGGTDLHKTNYYENNNDKNSVIWWRSWKTKCTMY